MLKQPTAEVLEYAISSVGHRLRRCHQIDTALFSEEVSAVGLTTVQFASLAAIVANEDSDATRVAAIVKADRSTIGSVIERLEAKGFIERQYRPNDKRTKRLRSTALGRAVLERANAAAHRSQERLMGVLDPESRIQLSRLLDLLIAGHDVTTPATNASRPH
jgi:DNA-binding MarR family transcriptional regulator